MNIKENLIENKFSNYSKEDGSLHIKKNINYLTIEKNNNTYCSKCENLVDEKDIYCKNCGEILENVKSKREKFINQEGEKANFKNIASSFNLVSGFKTSISALGILFVFSLIIKVLLIGENNQISELINPIHIMLFSNLASMDIYMSLFMNSAQSSVNFGFLILLILPIISFILPYRIFMKKNNISLVSHVKNSLGVGIIYSLLLVALSRMSQVQVSLSNGFDGSNMFNQYSYGIYLGFNMISVLFKAFIIGFISIFFMGLKRDYEKENRVVNIIKIALKTLLIGYILTLIILLSLHLAKINYIYDLGLNNYTSTTSLGFVLSQLAIYLWAFANLIPINLGVTTVSILSLFNSNLSLDLILLLGSLIALSSLIFIIVGCKLESKYKSKDIKPVIIFSGFYAVIMGVIGLLTTIYVGDNAASMLNSLSAMQMGFNFVIGMIISFVYSLIMTLIGYKLNIFNNLEEENEG